MNTGRPISGRWISAPVTSLKLFVEAVAPADDPVGAQFSRQGLLMAIAGGGENPALGSQGPDGCDSKQTDRAAPDYEHRLIVGGKGFHHGVQATAEWFYQDRFLVGQPLGHRMDLERVCDQGCAPSAARVPAIPRLNARGKIAVHNHLAQAEISLPARRARRVDAPNRAAQTGFDGHAVPPGHAP